MTKFNPSDHLMKMSGKDYLEVKWRIVWFREEHPKGGIITDLESLEPVVMKATIKDHEGVILGTGYGTPKKQGKAAQRPFEGAETAAIGRALACAGYGTQFTGEEEGEHLADAPIENKTLVDQAQELGGDIRGNITPQWIVDNQLSENIPAAASLINLLGLAGKPVALSEPKIKLYRHWRQTLDPKDAAAKTIAGEQPKGA